MKKLFLIPICLLFLFSCKKEAAYLPEDSLESVYKQKLQKILKTTPLSPEELKKKHDEGVVNLEFKTYDEAYRYFSFLEKKIPDTLVSVAERKFANPTKPNQALLASGMDYANYSTYINSTAGVSHTFGTGTVNCLYSVDVSMAFFWYQSNSHSPKVYQTFSFTGITAGTPTLYYGGVGTAAGTAYITTYAPNTGMLTGAMQGTVTIAGTQASFIISVTGGFTVQPPASYSSGPPPSVTISWYLNASSS